MTEISNNFKINKLPYLFAKKHKVLLKQSQDELKLIYHEALPLATLFELQRYLNTKLALLKVDIDTFQSEITICYEMDSQETAMVLEGMEQALDLSQLIDELPQTEDLLESQDDAPIIRLLNAIFSQAVKESASDIHIEIFEKSVLVRMRVDGVLRVILEIQRALAPLLISRIKVMAKLDIAEKRIPQDGRLALKIGEHNIDVRVSTLPSNHGERIVMRILDKKSSGLDLAKIGLSPDNQKRMESLIKHPHGIILVTGPTGSGKTTSLYGMLNSLNEDTRNILTIEDPIEYDLPGIGQTQVNSKINMTFAIGLRAILRQDPDVVMIGEIRDLETAEIAIQASLTGHLVLSTLHTNTALSSITRLKDMGIENFLLGSSIVGLISQRLVRRLCLDCKIQYQSDAGEMEILGIEKPTTLYKPNGCEECKHQGYNGRIGIFEVIEISEILIQDIHNNQKESVMETHVRKTVPSITKDGFNNVINGITTISEVLRVSNH